LLGVLFMLLTLIIPYVLVENGVKQLYLALVQYNTEVWGSLRYPLWKLGAQLRNQKIYILPGIVALAVLGLPKQWMPSRLQHFFQRLRPMTSEERWLFVGLCGASFLSILTMGKYWPNHFEPLLFLLIPFTTLGFSAALTLMPGWLFKVAFAAGCFLY